MFFSDPADQRVMGEFPLSIATSLAFESLLNMHPETKHNSIPIHDYGEIWINVNTLIRNVLNAFDSFVRKDNNVPLFVKTVYREMSFIIEFCSKEGKGIKPVFYASRYEGLSKLYPHALLKVPKPKLQKEHKVISDKRLDLLLRNINKPETSLTAPQRIRVYKNKITDKSTASIVMLTHVPYDLVSIYNFSKLILLESHTGKLKPRNLWYTKLTHGSKMVSFPFNEKIILIFGDKEVFLPIPSRYREAVINLANEQKWSVVTASDRIVRDVAKIKDPEIKKYLVDLLS